MGLREWLLKKLDSQVYIDYEENMLTHSFYVTQRWDNEPGVYGLYVCIQTGGIFTSRLLCSFDHPEQGEPLAENLNAAWRRICEREKGA